MVFLILSTFPGMRRKHAFLDVGFKEMEMSKDYITFKSKDTNVNNPKIRLKRNSNAVYKFAVSFRPLFHHPPSSSCLRAVDRFRGQWSRPIFENRMFFFVSFFSSFSSAGYSSLVVSSVLPVLLTFPCFSAFFSRLPKSHSDAHIDSPVTMMVVISARTSICQLIETFITG
jgi:hypothetical protein